MQCLNNNQCFMVYGGVLTDKQVESLVAKAGGYAMKAGFLGLMAATTKFVPLSSFLIGGIGAPMASLFGSYLFYENKDYLLQLLNDTKSALPNSLNIF